MAGKLVRGYNVMTAAVYEPSKSLRSRFSRRITPFLARRTLPVNLDRPLISFTFDDCPKSAVENGVKPLEQEGWTSTIYIAAGLLGTENHLGRQVTGPDVSALNQSGHEIGGHTFSHVDAQSQTLDAFKADINRNQDALSCLGVSDCETFAYPFGQTKPDVKTALTDRFEGLRGIQPLVHHRQVDLNQIGSLPVFSGSRFEAALNAIKMSVQRPAWLTLFTHDIREDHSDWGCSPEEFKALVACAKQSGARVMPVADAIRFLKGQAHETH
jgi:peptidoglycan/xylan/chitin deacetylase (PgdA/CDA1 family)